MKKIIFLVYLVVLTFSFTACSGKDAKTNYSCQTLTGKVIAIDGSKVTVLLGTLNEMSQGDKQTPPEMPNGQKQDGQTPPEMPNGQKQDGQTPPEMPNGQKQDGQTPPEMPNGQKQDGQTPPEMPNGQKQDGQTPPEMPNGQQQDGQTPPEMPNGQQNGQMPGGDMNLFTAGEESAAFDLSKADIKIESGTDTKSGSITDIVVDSILVMEIGENNSVDTVTVKMAGMNGANGQNGSDVKAEGQIGSWNMGGTDASSVDGDDYAYDSALFISSNEINNEKSSVNRINGTYDESSADGITINDSESGNNGITVYDASYIIKNAQINLLTDADGTDTCDFSGKGSAVAAFGKSADVTIEDSNIHTSGVATMPIFADDGAVLTVKNSTLQSDGGTLYQSYLNSPSQTVMVAPPWILGIMGTSRCSNMMGTNTVSNFIDCDTSAGAWAVLSTDAGTNMALNVYNTTLTLNNKDESKYLLQEEGGQISKTLDNPYTENFGSGYGSYVIGNAAETFAGATMNVGTYASIFTGGSALYTALEKGKTYDLTDFSGNVTTKYTASENKATVINSDTFGFMAHQGTNTITLEKGTEVNSGYATFLVKSGSSNEALTATVDNTKIKNGGVMIQVMDNDDATNGGMMSADDEANTNGQSQNFIAEHTEEPGFFSESAKEDSTKQNFTFTNGTYNGNIYNASGSDGLNATTLNVTFGKGAVYSGAAASTSAIHVTYDGSAAVKSNGGYAFDSDADASSFADKYQNIKFSINEYFDIGQVANKVYSNGGNAINVTLTDDAVWTVTGTSLISNLTISDNAKVVIPEGVTLTVGDQVYTSTTLTAD